MELKKDYIHIVGSQGFIGKNIQKYYSQENLINWSHSSKKNNFDIFNKKSWNNILKTKPQKIIFLSWPGLPNYDSSFHVSKNLPFMIYFFEELIKQGVKRIVVTGTCYEYGSISGALSENELVEPLNQYAIAKNTLRQVLQKLCHENKVSFAWARIFYPYGEYQNPNSLIPSLKRSIDNKEKFFQISSGDQIRDFIEIKQVVFYLLFLVNNSQNQGIFNIGSGNPKSVKNLVEEIVENEKSNIEIIKSDIKIRKNEPKKFWADMTKLKNLTLNKC